MIKEEAIEKKTKKQEGSYVSSNNICLLHFTLKQTLRSVFSQMRENRKFIRQTEWVHGSMSDQPVCDFVLAKPFSPFL